MARCCVTGASATASATELHRMNTTPLLQTRQLSHGWPGLTLFDRLDVDIHRGITLVTKRMMARLAS